MPGYDFNGDGRDDILWRNITTGSSSNWLGTPSGGFHVNDEVALDPWGHEYVVAVGDFNGDGRDDTLWRSDGTELFMGFTEPDGAFYFYWNLGFVPPEVPVSWHVVGAGDFNGDGLDDILWRNDDGRISNWLSNGDYEFTINDANAMTSALAAWPVQAIGDFDGNGRDDILVRHANGALDLLNGSADGGFDADFSEPFTQASLDWQIAGVGDFNGDGRDDILWRHTNGTISNWLSAGDAAFAEFVINDANAWAAVPNNWQVVGVGDYNGDGRDDILWRNFDNGAISNWLATETGGWIINDANALAIVASEWSVEPNPSGLGYWDY